ncbi:MAG: TadE/TadG family type IV pilus assembly protein [Steroidobacteraceae bacterium]
MSPALHPPRHLRGLALVETAIALPILLIFLVAAAEVGRAFVQYTLLSHHVHGAARYLAEQALDGTTGIPNLDRIDPDALTAGDTATIRELARRLLVFGTTCPGAPACATPTEVLEGLDDSPIDISVIGVDVEARARYDYQPLLVDVLPRLLGVSDAFHFDVRVRMRPL